MDTNIRNLIIYILIAIVIVLIIYAFGDDNINSNSSNNTNILSNVPQLKIITPKTNTAKITQSLQKELFTTPNDDQIQSLINLVSVGRLDNTDKVGWVNSLSGQTQVITNPLTDIRVDIKYSTDEFMRDVEILPGIAGSQFQKIIDAPLPTVLYNQTTTTTSAGTTTTTAGTTTTTAGTTTTSAGTTTTSAGTTTTSAGTTTTSAGTTTTSAGTTTTSAGTTTTTAGTTTTKNSSITEPPTRFILDSINNPIDLIGVFYIKSGNKYLYYDESNKNLYFTDSNKSKFELKSIQNRKQLTISIAGTNNYLFTDILQSEKVVVKPSTADAAQLFYYLVNPLNTTKVVLGGKLFDENTQEKVIKSCLNSWGFYCYDFFTGQESQFFTLEKVETFRDTGLPKSDKYSKILLKIVNKSKSGVPNPYYFNPRTGFKFYIIFNTNSALEKGAAITCDALFTSISDGQQVKFDTCNVVYSTSKPNKFQFTFIKSSTPDNQLLPASDYGEIGADLLITQKFDLQLVTKTTPSFGNITFLNLINQNVIPAISTLTYTINVSNIKTNESQDILSYEINLAALLARRENMQEYTYKKLGNITEEILNDKVGNIVAPMFLLDSKLNNMENNLKKVQDAYFFNNLSNNQSNYKFFSTT